MDDQVAEEDPYLDGDLAALPDDALEELEEDAIRSTQHPAGHTRPVLPTTKSRIGVAPTSLANGFGRLSVAPENTFGRQDVLPDASSDYGDFDDEMLDGEIFDGAEQPDLISDNPQNEKPGYQPGESTQREIWRKQRYGEGRPGNVYQRQPAQTDPARQTDSVRYEDTQQGPAPRRALNPSLGVAGHAAASTSNADLSGLQGQIARLLQEREHLQQAVQAANDTAYAKAGEIAIVRANASKIEREYEHRAKSIETSHADELREQREKLGEVEKDLHDITTQKQFLENESKDSSNRIRDLQRDLQRLTKSGDRTSDSRDGGTENVVLTPKKQKTALADGFNDDEIQPISPSKFALRSKIGTPKAGSKRKRKAVEDSPGQPSLDLDQSVQVYSFDEPAQDAQLPEQHDVQIERPSRKAQSQNFAFAQSFLNHRINHKKERTIEALSRFKLPSQPEDSLCTMLFDKLGPSSIPPNTESLPSATAIQVISIWKQCKEESFLAPIPLLIDQVETILISNPFKTAPDLTNNLMSLLQETADLTIIPRCQKMPPPKDAALISSTSCLEVIHLMAQQTSISREEATRFWRTIRFDFIMMLLNFIHPIEELHLIIQILHTSILPNTFAMIIPTGDGKQDVTEARVLDHLSRLLVEAPRPAQGEPALSGIQLAELRLSILSLIEEMNANEYAVLAVCRHKLLIGRLVRLMNDSLVRAYDYTSAHPYLIAMINSATRLLYYLVNNFPENINMQEKLSVIPGGEKKFLIVLTRLAFSEGGILEGGIEDDVVDLAHRMLEERVSPEEAEGLIGVMSSAPTTRVPTERPESMDKGCDE